MEKLIQEMREVNMESLAISPPEESQQFLDGKNHINSLFNENYNLMKITQNCLGF